MKGKAGYNKALLLTPTPTNDNTIPIKTTKDDDDEPPKYNGEAKIGIYNYVK